MAPQMEMEAFLSEVAHAVGGVLGLIWAEHHEIDELRSRVTALRKDASTGYEQAGHLMDSDDMDDRMAGVGRRFETYFSSEKELARIEVEIPRIEATIELHAFSRDSLSGSVLQFAKQGISLVHGGLDVCPAGPTIGSQHLKDIIWQGRNQSIHWEEGSLHPPVLKVFRQLAVDFGPVFDNCQTASLAFQVVTLLEWKDLATFNKSMRLLS